MFIINIYRLVLFADCLLLLQTTITHHIHHDYIIEYESINLNNSRFDFELKCDLNTQTNIQWLKINHHKQNINDDTVTLNATNKQTLKINDLNSTHTTSYICKTNEKNVTYKVIFYEKINYTSPNLLKTRIIPNTNSIEIEIYDHEKLKKPINLIYLLQLNTLNDKSIIIRGNIRILNNNNNETYHLIIDNLKTNTNYTFKLYNYNNSRQIVLINQETILTKPQSIKLTKNYYNIINICDKINDTTLLIDYSINNLLKKFNKLSINSTKIDSYLVEFSNNYLKIHANCINLTRCIYKIPSNQFIFNFNLNIFNNKYSYLCDLTKKSIRFDQLNNNHHQQKLPKAYIIDCQIKSSNQLQFYIIHNHTTYLNNLWFKIEYKLNNDYINNNYNNLTIKKDNSFQIVTVNETSRDLLKTQSHTQRLFLVKILVYSNNDKLKLNSEVVTSIVECKMPLSNIYTIFSVIFGAIIAILILMLGFFICFLIKKQYIDVKSGYFQTLSKKKNQFFKIFGNSNKLRQKSTHHHNHQSHITNKHLSFIDTNKINTKQIDSFNKNNYVRLLKQKWHSNSHTYVPTNYTASLTNTIRSKLSSFRSFRDDDSIGINDFEQYVSKMHVDGDLGFAQLYEEICSVTKNYSYTSDVALLDSNRSKNRYTNILTYDHSRVKLNNNDDKEDLSDYINANYVDGYLKQNAYIATQGPMPNTFNDFWKMIWEQNCSIIVMITNVREKGRIKCDQYWPDDGSEIYGNIQVSLLHTLNLTFYTKRVFTVKIKNNKKSFRELARASSRSNSERLVYQYQFTDWPDHGVPSSVLPVLTFIRKSSQQNPEFGGPIVVHCSAGVGRTGTYIVIDSMLKQIEHKKNINIHSFLKHIRHQRNFLVQTEEQFIFIYDALVEFIKSGDTELTEQNYKNFIHCLQNVDSNGTKLIDKQFKLITEFKPKEYHVSFAQMPFNRPKNRNQSIIPLNTSRVLLSKKPGVEGSEYINATYLHGACKQDEFIITQHPLDNLYSNFWQMIWDNNSTHVIALYGDDKLDQCSNYWLEQGTLMKCDSFSVILKEETFDMDFIYRDFLLQSIDEDYEFNCRIISSCYWPDSCTPIKSAFDLINKLRSMRTQYSQGPIIIHDLYGSQRAATLCALYSAQELIMLENSVNIYEIAKMYHAKRPEIWSTSTNILFLYQAIECLFDDFIQQNNKQDSEENVSSSDSSSTTISSSTNNSPIILNDHIETICTETSTINQLESCSTLKQGTKASTALKLVNNFFNKTLNRTILTKKQNRQSPKHNV